MSAVPAPKSSVASPTSDSPSSSDPAEIVRAMLTFLSCLPSSSPEQRAAVMAALRQVETSSSDVVPILPGIMERRQLAIELDQPLSHRTFDVLELDQRVDKRGVASRIRYGLQRRFGRDTLRVFLQRTPRELIWMRGFGLRSKAQWLAVLASWGLRQGMAPSEIDLYFKLP